MMKQRFVIRFTLRSLLLTVGAVAIIFGVIQLLVSFGTTHISFESEKWSYSAKIRGVNGIAVLSSNLKWDGEDLPVNPGCVLTTPIGSYSALNGKWVPHWTDPPWWSDSYQPKDELKRKRTCSKIASTSLKDGYYPISVQKSFYGVDGILQLEGTPDHWIFVVHENQGFWAAPDRLNKLAARHFSQ